jgi:cysteinyl-tRNA synthetase
MLRTHYRQPMDWTVRGLRESDQILDSWTKNVDLAGSKDEELAPGVREALADDLNTPQAIAELHSLSASTDGALATTLRALGFNRRPPPRVSVDEGKVTGLIEQRNAARKAKDFKESDRIRDELAAMGVVLKDSKEGTTWEIAR